MQANSLRVHSFFANKVDPDPDLMVLKDTEKGVLETLKHWQHCIFTVCWSTNFYERYVKHAWR